MELAEFPVGGLAPSRQSGDAHERGPVAEGSTLQGAQFPGVPAWRANAPPFYPPGLNPYAPAIMSPLRWRFLGLSPTVSGSGTPAQSKGVFSFAKVPSETGTSQVGSRSPPASESSWRGRAVRVAAARPAGKQDWRAKSLEFPPPAPESAVDGRSLARGLAARHRAARAQALSSESLGSESSTGSPPAKGLAQSRSLAALPISEVPRTAQGTRNSPAFARLSAFVQDHFVGEAEPPPAGSKDNPPVSPALSRSQSAPEMPPVTTYIPKQEATAEPDLSAGPACPSPVKTLQRSPSPVESLQQSPSPPRASASTPATSDAGSAVSELWTSPPP